MTVIDAIDVLRKRVTNPSIGLPDDIFYFITSITPMINVDLLIKDERGRILMAWRNDQYAGKGWHLPGGIVRFKEKLTTRIEKVAETEVGTSVHYDSAPFAVHEIFAPDRDVRGHFISLLYNCSLDSSFVPDNKGLTSNDAGYLQWHDACPDDLLGFQAIYRKYL